MAYHAVLSPSSSHRWSRCYASIKAAFGREEKKEFDETRDGGTCGHQMHAEMLVDPEIDPQSYLGRTMVFWRNDLTGETGEDFVEQFWEREDALVLRTRGEVPVTQEIIDKVMMSVNFVRKIHEMKGGMLLVEQRVPISHVTGEEDAGGTSDVIIVGDGWIHGIDLKLGFVKVKAYDVLEESHLDIVSNEPVPEKTRMNLQGAMYCGGARIKHADKGPFKSITFTIVQPPLQHVSEYTCSAEELDETEAFLRDAAEKTRAENPTFAPGTDTCRNCRAAGDCAPQDAFILEQAVVGLDDIQTAKPRHVSDIQLGDKYALMGMITDWAKAIAERVYGNLKEGLPVTRSDGLSYKLVAGKKGDRSWSDEEQAMAALKKMRLKDEQIFKMSLKSPTQIEPLSKPPKVKKGETPGKPMLGKTQWNRLLGMITQSDGKPAVVLSTDPRPPIAQATDGFDDVGSDNSDLF